MVSQINRGVLDLIGAARPSIADPFLPNKIDEGREDEIRECIGCNMCTSGDYLAYPMRCTQNPTMGEEWRRGWHPVHIEKAASKETVLVVGGGPCGLEAALALSDRGYEVILSEAKAQLGGRVLTETTLKPLSDWRRVADHRTYMLSQRANVQTYTRSELSIEDIFETGASHVAIATGSFWRTDFIGLQHHSPVNITDINMIVSVDEVLNGARPKGKVVVYDDDHYYMASVIAEQLASEGATVTLITPETDIAGFTHNTLEHEHIQIRLRQLGVTIVCNKAIREVRQGGVTLACVYVDQTSDIEADVVIPVTSRTPSKPLP